MTPIKAMKTTRARRPYLTRAAAWRHIAALYETKATSSRICLLLLDLRKNGIISAATLRVMRRDVWQGIWEQQAATGSTGAFFEPTFGPNGINLRATYALLMAHLAEPAR